VHNVTVRDVAHSALVGNIVYRMVQRGSGVFISAADVAEATCVLVSVAERCFLSQDLTRHLPERYSATVPANTDYIWWNAVPPAIFLVEWRSTAFPLHYTTDRHSISE